MTDAPAPDAGLPAFLAHRARTASDRRLVADAVGGILVATAVAIWRPGTWVLLLCAALCFAAFGLWGIADREWTDRSTHARNVRTLGILRTAAAVLGALAGAGLLLSGLSLALGTWIS